MVKGGCSYKLYSHKNKIGVGDVPQKTLKNIQYGLSQFNSVDCDGKSQKKTSKIFSFRTTKKQTKQRNSDIH